MNNEGHHHQQLQPHVQQSQQFGQTKEDTKQYPLNTTSDLVMTSPSCNQESILKAKQRFDTVQALLKQKNTSLSQKTNMHV
jgi:hypothetical protein